MFTRSPRYIWVEWEKPEDWQEGDPDYTGFRARILANPTAGDVHGELEMRRSVLKQEITGDDYLQFLAPRVVEWDYRLEDVNGEIVDVPAPGENPDNWQAFRLLELSLHVWLCDQIRNVHVPKGMMPGSKPVSITERQNQNGSVPEPVRQTS